MNNPYITTEVNLLTKHHIGKNPTKTKFNRVNDLFNFDINISF